MTVVNTTPERYPVLDRYASVGGSKLEEWLDDGRGVNVFENVDLSSASIGALTFAPAFAADSSRALSTPPHWTLRLKEGPLWDIRRFILYLRVGTASKLYGESEASYRAACRDADILRAATESPVDAPIGKVWRAFTIEHITYHTSEQVETVDRSGANNGCRPLASLSGYQVIAWSAIDH